MRDYGVVSPRFWIGDTGKALRGDPEAQVLALYLMTSPHANMIGVFHCPVIYMAHETGLSIEGASKALRRLSEALFCTFDSASDYVFVHRMAAFQVGASLVATDNRVKAVAREVSGIPGDRLKTAFLEIYGVPFCLQSAPLKPKGLARGSKAPTKPGTGTGTGTGEKSNASALPENFGISDAVRKWAQAKGIGNLDSHLESFVMKAKAKRYTYVDWDSAFMNAIRDDWAKLNGKPGAASPWAGAK